MIHPPTVVAIDDQKNELDAIVSALRGLDVACLPVLVAGTSVDLKKPLTGVRLLFFDINYLPGGLPKIAMFEAAATVLMKVIAPDNGPYVLVTWTTKSSDHSELMAHFADNIPDLPAPAVSASMAKEKFNLSGPDIGSAKNGGPSLRDQIQNILAEHPQVAALMNWEMNARRAAGDVVSSLLALFTRADLFSGRCGLDLEQLLTYMAAKAVGLPNIPNDPRAALNEALGPLLFDRIMHQPIDNESADLWTKAVAQSGRENSINPTHAPLLNAINHIAFDSSGPLVPGDRGVVFQLERDTGESLAEYAGISSSAIATQYMEVLDGKPPVLRGPVDKEMTECRWVLLGTRAVCDQAQNNGILRPVVLGLEVPAMLEYGKKLGFRIKSHGAAFCTPPFTMRNASGDSPVRVLVLNWNWTVSLCANDFLNAKGIYRLKESLMNKVSSTMSAHAARPGIIEF